MGPAASLKSLAVFESLTSAESAVFDRDVGEKSYRSGDSVRVEQSLLAVREGTIRLEVDRAVGRSEFAAVGIGGLVGEVGFFESDAVPVLAEAQSDLVCLALDRRALRRAFQYSRTGAVKFLAIFARSLSHKIRSANDVLQKLSVGGWAAGATQLRPPQLGRLDLEHLEALTGSRTYDEGAVLFHEGEESRELFVISDGEVEILRATEEGNPMSLARLGSGDVFGEMAFVDERPRSATAVARSVVRVHVLPSGSLDRVVEYNVGTALYLTSVICKIMARRLNFTLKRIGEL